MQRNFFIGALIGLILGFIIGWVMVNTQIQSQITNPKQQTAIAGTVSTKELDLRMNMRKLWEDHITWTRMYMVSAIADADDKDNVAQRLLKNQEDIGNAIKAYYGNDAGDKLTSLLKTHITTAVELIDAAQNNNQTALNAANTKWYNNANDIADFLSSANPNWPNDQMRTMMKDHLDLTKQEALDIINKRFDADIADYDKVHEQILNMADMLSAGIVKQFPDKF
ncbi:glycosyltransferase [Candidatus Daviesbacteria bacterium]|nr:glycosyltransferase [Candidatus Daviesbacteria bacterium]